MNKAALCRGELSKQEIKMGAPRVQVRRCSVLDLCRMESLENVSFRSQLQQQVEAQLDLMVRLKS